MSWARGVLDYGKYQLRRTQAVACITDRAQPNFGTIGRRLGTTADEAGYVFLRQPPASKLASLFRIDVRDHALGLVTRQVGGRVTEHPPGGWLGPRTPSLREGPVPLALRPIVVKKRISKSRRFKALAIRPVSQAG